MLLRPCLFCLLEEPLELNAVVLLIPIDGHQSASFRAFDVLSQLFLAGGLRMPFHPAEEGLGEGEEGDQARLVEAAEPALDRIIANFEGVCCEI